MPLVALVAALATIAPQTHDPAPSPGALSDRPCRLFGEFVDEAGAPVAGAVLRISGGPARSAVGPSPGAPRGWQHVTSATTGDDGKFSLSFVPPRTFEFILTANAPGYGSVGWEWSELEPGRELDLGTKVLEPKAVLAGHILDAEGNLEVVGWNVTAALFERNGAVRGRSMNGHTFVGPATGEFRMEGLAPGTWIVSATKGSQRVEPVTVTTKLRADTWVELRSGEPNPRRALVVTIGTQPFHTFQPDPGTVHAIARDGTRHLLTQAARRPNESGLGEWRLAHVAPGTYRVEVRDPRFAEWTHSAVRTAESVSANLVGSASLRVEVLDNETGARVEDYALVISYRNEPMRRSVFRVRERTAPQPVDGLYTGIVPGDLTLLVESEGWPACEEVDALAPGETRVLTVRVSHDFAATQPRVVSQPRAATRSGPVVLRGRVVDTHGRPLAGVAVQLTQGKYPGHDVPGTPSGSTSGTLDGKLVTIPVRYRDHATTTAVDGWFYFSGLGPGTHALLAQRGPWNDVWKTVELPNAEPVVLTLPDATLTAARLRLPEGESQEGLSLRLVRAPGEGLDIVRRARTMGDAAGLWSHGSDGAFPARHVPLGAWSFDVLRTKRDGDLESTEVVLRHEVTITEGSQELELDLRETFPGEAASVATLAQPVQEPAPPPATPPPDPPCRISGAFVDEAGRPLAGVTFSVVGTRGDAQRIERFGLPQGWENPAPVTTGDDGKFSVSFVPPRAFRFTFFSHVKGFENSAWMQELEPGQELDLGAVTLRREAVLVGHILDTEGNLLVDGWLVTAFQHGHVEVGIRLPMFAQSSVDTATGQFRVEIRDPRFVEWTQEGVRTGQPTSAQLVGSATLRLAVVDGETGSPVEDYHLDIAYRNASIGSNAVRVRERSQPRPPGGSYAGMLPGDLSLTVEAEGWPTARVNVDALAPDETRDVQVTLLRAATLRGRVVDMQGKPMPGIAVEVTRGAYPGHDRLGAGESLGSANVDGKQVRVRIGYRDAATTTAEDGSFEFEGLAPETHAVLALRGHWNDVWTTVELPRAEPLEATLPDAALAKVRLRLPEGESADGLRLDLGTKPGETPDLVRRIRTSHSSDPWTCAADGVFAARYLPVGAPTFNVLRTTEYESGAFHDTLLQHEVAVTGADVNVLELDLRDSFPVRVSLRTPAPAVEPVGFWVLQIRLKDEAGSSAVSTRSTRGTDGKDHHTQWRVPGTYRIEVYAPGILWSPPEPVQLARGAPNDFEIDLPLVGREVRVLQADGAPLANATVAYWTDTERRMVGTTDKDGKLVVVLLEGTLSLALPPQPDPKPAPAPDPALRGRAIPSTPTVDPTVLAGLTARARADFGPGDGPLELRLHPE